MVNDPTNRQPILHRFIPMGSISCTFSSKRINNELTGGVIIRATVQNSADDRNDNDVMEMALPIALVKR